jgi:hypothetical protein
MGKVLTCRVMQCDAIKVLREVARLHGGAV